MSYPLDLRRIIGLVVLVLGLLTAGCSLTTSRPTRFYLLTPMDRSERLEQIAGDKLDLALGVGPITIPPYLDRPQIVTRLDANRLDMAEFEQWAEPLQDSVARILTENLSRLLSTHQVEMFPWRRSARFNYQVVVTLLQFESIGIGETALTARWVLLNEAEAEEGLRNTFRVTVPREAEDYASIVETMSAALSQLSRDIAVAIRALAQSS